MGLERIASFAADLKGLQRADYVSQGRFVVEFR